MNVLPDSEATVLSQRLVELEAQLADARARALKAEEILNVVIDGIPGLLSYIDKDRRYVFANRVYEDWWGISKAELAGRSVSEVLDEKTRSELEPRVQQAFKGEAVAFEQEYLCPDRSRYARVNYVPHKDQNGAVQGLLILAQDITAEHDALQRLSASEQQHQFLFNALPQLVWVADAQGQTEYLNQHWYVLTNLQPGESLTQEWPRIVHPDDFERVVEAWTEAYRKQQPFDVEYRLLNAAGDDYRWVLFRQRPIFSPSGRLTKWVGAGIDIHDRKQSEREVSRAKAQIADILNSIRESFIAIDRDWRITYVNDRVAQRLGRAREDILGQNIWDISPESKSTQFFDQYRRVLEERVPAQFEVEYDYPTGTRWYEAHVYPTDEGLSAYVLDITERKLANDALKSSKHRLQLAVEAHRIGIADRDIASGRVIWSDQQCELFGIAPEEFQGTAEQALSFVLPEDAARVEADWQARIAGKTPSALEYSIRRADGQVRCIRSDSRVLNDENRNPRRVVSVNVDVTTERAAEQALRHSEERFRTLTEATPQLVWSTRADGWCDYLSRQWIEFTGIPEEEQLGFGWVDVLHPEDRQRAIGSWLEAVSGRAPYDLEYRIRRHDGAYRWFKTRGVALFDREGQREKWLGTCTDIDDQKRAIEALERANADLEQFAFAAAHDLQEPLRNVALYTQLLERRYSDAVDKEGREFIAHANKGAKRMVALIQDLLSFTRAIQDLPDDARYSNSDAVLRDVIANLESTIAATGGSVTAAALPDVEVTPTHLTQVLQNLIGNALKYGQSTRPPHVEISAAREDRAVYFTIRDNGQGIAPAHYERIFGIFKRLHGRDVPGNGIGLAICQRIVTHYGGRIWVESEVGRGSEFHFTLPAALPVRS